MTIPNVTMSWCQRQAECKWCSSHIEAGDPMVTVFYWNKGSNNRRWNVKRYYHPQCWIDQGLDYLRMNPYVPYTRKPKLSLTPKQSKKRYAILRRKAALEQRRRNIKADYPDRVLIEARMDRQVAEMMVQIASLGGIPPKWLERNA